MVEPARTQPKYATTQQGAVGSWVCQYLISLARLASRTFGLLLHISSISLSHVEIHNQSSVNGNENRSDIVECHAMHFPRLHKVGIMQRNMWKWLPDKGDLMLLRHMGTAMPGLATGRILPNKFTESERDKSQRTLGKR